MVSFNIVLFDGFETLDATGPVEVIGQMPETYSLGYFSRSGGSVLSSQQLGVNTRPFSEMDTAGVLLIPGGTGTRKLVDDIDFISKIKEISQNASYALTVCTGSALLAKTGLLCGKNATSNKRAFDWVSGTCAEVHWVKNARWVVDGKYYTSSGVSAGIDMTLGFVSDIHGDDAAREICRNIEYTRNKDKTNDPFAVEM